MVVHCCCRWRGLGSIFNLCDHPNIHDSIWKDLLLIRLFMWRVGGNGWKWVSPSGPEGRHASKTGEIRLHLRRASCFGDDGLVAGFRGTTQLLQRLDWNFSCRRLGDWTLPFSRTKDLVPHVVSPCVLDEFLGPLVKVQDHSRKRQMH